MAQTPMELRTEGIPAAADSGNAFSGVPMAEVAAAMPEQTTSAIRPWLWEPATQWWSAAEGLTVEPTGWFMFIGGKCERSAIARHSGTNDDWLAFAAPLFLEKFNRTWTFVHTH